VNGVDEGVIVDFDGRTYIDFGFESLAGTERADQRWHVI
jgi:hypothetical protein